MLRPLSVVAVLWSFGCTHPTALPAPGSADLEELRDLSYGPEETSVLDLYRRPGAEDQRLVVFVHGGSWVGGDKANLDKAPGFVDWFLDHGYVVAAPNFRRASSPRRPHQEVGIEEMATDLGQALGWLQDHHQQYGYREDGIVMVGFSSGAHLVALLASDARYLDEAQVALADLGASVSLDVHAYDAALALEMMRGSDIDANRTLITHLFGTTPAEQAVFSPVTYIADPDVPPSLLISAEPSDSPLSKGFIARETSATHARRLEQAGHDAVHVHLDASSHSGLVMGFGAEGHPATEAVDTLLARLP